MRTPLFRLLSAAALTALLGACAPTRHDPFANLGSTAPNAGLPLKSFTVAEVLSENTKTVPEYMAVGKALTFGTVNSTLLPGIQKLLADNFKTVIEADTLDQAQASGADFIAVIDIYGVAKNYGFGVPDFHWDSKVFFMKPNREQIAAIHGESHKRSVVGGIIGAGGLLPTQMATTAATNHAAETEALELAVADFKKNAIGKISEAGRERTAQAPASPTPRAISSDVDTANYKAEPDPRKLALVVGIEKYKGLPDALYAERDAAAVRNHLIALGYPERNIKYLVAVDATRSGLQKNIETWLSRVAKQDSEIFFYFSGHGSPDPESGKAYLIPWDGDPQYLSETAYPVQKLYESLGSLKVKSVVVALDSCFSGTGGRSVLPKGVRPLVTKIDVGEPLAQGAPIAALTASGGNQISGSLDEQGHGLFTYFLLKGLNGAAPLANGHVTVDGLYKFLKPSVEDEAARENRNQTPQLLRGAGLGTVDPILR